MPHEASPASRDQDSVQATAPEDLPITLERETFLLTLLRDLTGTLEELVGVENASGFVQAVGRRMGERLLDQYLEATGEERLSVSDIGPVLCDLKRRIRGEYESENDGPNVLRFRGSECPFGKAVVGRESLCMMTSNVFGIIAADATGYAHVELQETLASGGSCCRVRVTLDEDQAQSGSNDGPGVREYYRSRSGIGD